VAAEVQTLLSRGIDVFHLCDAEFNLDPRHALAVCDELIRRGLNRRIAWYAYLTILPFPRELADRMRRAGCAGINFTTDAAHPDMLRVYCQPHGLVDIRETVERCRAAGITVMLDLLLGGPGETPDSVAHTIAAIRETRADCVGTALGIRVYPGTAMARAVARQGEPDANPAIRRHYPGSVDLLQPTFYIDAALGNNPARLVRELIAGDPRFFPPEEEGQKPSHSASDHNYNANFALVEAIAKGARGAYWDILRQSGAFRGVPSDHQGTGKAES
jgi:radical SAM superfamily enzyme YgiQ (UPF0313 family)